jgi:prevent-host-death family protein
MRKVNRQGVEEARNQLPKLIEAAQAGHSTVITKRGRAVAVLAPLSSDATAFRQKSLLALAGTGRKLWGRNTSRTITELRDEWSR